DPVAAFRNLCGALRSGGRLGFVCYQPREKNEWAEVTLGAVLPVLPSQELPALYHPGRPGPFFLESEARIRSILEPAGYSAIRVEPLELAVHLGGAMTLDEAVDYALEVGPAARAIADAGKEFTPACREALAKAYAPFAGERGVWLG